MADKMLMAEAHDAVKKAVAALNEKARSLLAEVAAFKDKSDEKLLAADSDRVISLAMDLVDFRSQLAEAVKTRDALRRRA